MSGHQRTRLRLGELTRDEVRAVAADGLIVIPFGSTEQHGPHLPTGTDTLHLEHVVSAAAERASTSISIAVAPALPFGYCEYHLPFGGTMSLSGETFLRVAADLGRSLAEGGCRRLFFVNGHGGNHSLLEAAAQDLSVRYEIHVAMASWWQPGGQRLSVQADGLEARVPGHAGAFETSLGLAIHPELVGDRPGDRACLVSAALPANGRSPLNEGRVYRHAGWQEFDGFTDYPARGTAARGRAFLQTAIDALGAAFVEFAAENIVATR